MNTQPPSLGHSTGPLLWVGVLLLVSSCTPSAENSPDSPYAAPPDAPYTARDVVVDLPDGARLAGTLTLPAEGAPHPVVVTITGSGLQDRDEHIRGVGNDYRPFRQIADTLARRGIATLRLDDPGVGGSDPFASDATPFDYGDDIGAAVAWLRARSDIDPQRVAVLGHSEGSVVAPYVAATDGGLAAVVLLAAPAYTLRRVNRFQRGIVIDREMDLDDAAKEAELDRTERGAELQATRNPWRAAVWDYDPLPTAREVEAPVLLIHGSTDRQITPDQSDSLAAAFRAGGNPDVTLRIFPETNHMLLADSIGDPSGYRSLPSHQVRPEILGAIADWLVERLR